MYLSQFSLDVQHKLGKLHIIPDALSQLESGALSPKPDNVLNGTDVNEYKMAYHITFVEMANDFKVGLKKTYSDNKR